MGSGVCLVSILNLSQKDDCFLSALILLHLQYFLFLLQLNILETIILLTLLIKPTVLNFHWVSTDCRIKHEFLSLTIKIHIILSPKFPFNFISHFCSTWSPCTPVRRILCYSLSHAMLIFHSKPRHMLGFPHGILFSLLYPNNFHHSISSLSLISFMRNIQTIPVYTKSINSYNLYCFILFHIYVMHILFCILISAILNLTR